MRLFPYWAQKLFYERWWYKTFGVKWCLVWSHMHIWGVCVMTSPVTARISKKVNFDRHRPFLGGRFDEGIWPTSGFSFHLQTSKLQLANQTKLLFAFVNVKRMYLKEQKSSALNKQMGVGMLLRCS